MEDQSADSSDLTDDAAAASVPQGKSARTRHRLPRQKVRQPGEGEAAQEDVRDEVVQDEVVQDEVTQDVAVDEATPEVVAEAPEPAGDTPVTESETAVEPASEAKRGRRPWRRAKAAETDAEIDADPAGDEVLVPHRPAGRGLKVAAVAAGVAFIAAGAFAGAALQPYLADRAVAQTKFRVAETAADAITTLWTYTPDDMAQLPERSAKYLGGDFATDYKRYIDGIAAPNKQAQISNDTQVLGAAVESLTPTEAVAIVYTNSVSTSPLTKGIPSLRYLSYRVSMKRDADRWLMTQMTAVTKLDLTPRL